MSPLINSLALKLLMLFTLLGAPQFTIPQRTGATASSSGAGTFTHVQGTYTSTGSSITSIGVTLGATPTVGDVICVAIIITDATGLAIKDGNGNSFTLTTHSPLAGTGFQAVLAYLQAPASPSKTIVATWTTPSFAAIWADDFAISSGTWAYDTDATALNQTASGTTLNLPSITPTGSGELLYALGIPGNSIVAPTSGGPQGSWTGANIDSSITGCATEYDLSASTATAVNFTDSASGDTYSGISMAIAP